jgi:hypothetical protein
MGVKRLRKARGCAKDMAVVGDASILKAATRVRQVAQSFA